MTTRRAKTKPKLSPKDIIKGGKLPENTLPICVRGDLAAQYEAGQAELAQAMLAQGDSLAGVDTTEIRERLDAIAEEMQAYTLEFKMRALKRPDWQALEDEHPPRQDEETGAVHKDDRRFGVNVSTFFPALLPKATIEPELDAEDWTDLLTEKLTDRQIAVLSNTAWNLNKDFYTAPFLSAASKKSPSSGSK